MTPQEIFAEYKIYPDESRLIAQHLRVSEPYSEASVTAILAFYKAAKDAGLTVKKAIAAARQSEPQPNPTQAEASSANPEAGQEFQGALATSIGGFVQSATALYQGLDASMSQQEALVATACVQRVNEAPLRTMQMIAEGLNGEGFGSPSAFFPIAPEGANLPVFAAVPSPILFQGESALMLSSSTVMEVEVEADDSSRVPE